MLRFRLLPGSGRHSQRGPDGKTRIYLADEDAVIESDLDLAAKFPNKFERLDPIQPVGDPDGDPQAEAPGEDPPVRIVLDLGEEPTSALGRDITHKFPKAQAENFLVLCDGGAFYVVEPEAPDVPLNSRRLHKDQVEPFIEEYLST